MSNWFNKLLGKKEIVFIPLNHPRLSHITSTPVEVENKIRELKKRGKDFSKTVEMEDRKGRIFLVQEHPDAIYVKPTGLIHVGGTANFGAIRC